MCPIGSLSGDSSREKKYNQPRWMRFSFHFYVKMGRCNVERFHIHININWWEIQGSNL